MDKVKIYDVNIEWSMLVKDGHILEREREGEGEEVVWYKIKSKL